MAAGAFPSTYLQVLSVRPKEGSPRPVPQFPSGACVWRGNKVMGGESAGLECD